MIGLRRRLQASQIRHLVLLSGLALLALINLGAWVRQMATTGIHTDFASYLTFAYLGVHAGWPHLYDWQLTRPITHLFGSAYWPNQYPPFTMLLFVPLLYLPYPVAYFLFLALMLAALLGTWWLLSPPASRAVHLLLMFALLPVGYCLWLGQVIPLVLLTVAISWKLLEGHRDLLAGMVLFGLVLKPNLVLLLPFALLASGRWRAVAGLAAVGVLSAAFAYLLLTQYGVSQYIDHLRSVTAEQPRFLIDSGLTMVGLFGLGPGLLIADLAVLGATCWIAYTTRGDGPAAGFAAAIVGSLLVTTYLHWQDLVMVLPAVWLWLRAHPARRYTIPCVIVVFALADFPLAVPQVLIGWLVIMTVAAGARLRTPQLAGLQGVPDRPTEASG